jgi:hypothetical protein
MTGDAWSSCAVWAYFPGDNTFSLVEVAPRP